MRVARNLRNHHFPQDASEQERQAVLECIRQAFHKKSCFKDGSLLLLDRLDPLDRKVLEEQHTISHLSATQGSARAVMMSQAQNCSILINEEDHLRIQAFSPGLALYKIRQTAHAVEQCLHNSLQFAYSEREGYLSSCPQNSGTGIRISTMLFLPGLIILQGIKPLIQACIQDAYTVRGAYGEGSQTQGYLLQLSLQAPYTQQIQTSLKKYAQRCRHVIQQERLARMALLTGSSSLLRKRVRRAKQQLKHSRSLSVTNGMQILAIYRLGVCLGFLPPDFRRAVMPKSDRTRYLQGFDRLSRQIQTAHIRRRQVQCMNGDSPDSSELGTNRENDIRASLLQEGLEAVIESKIKRRKQIKRSAAFSEISQLVSKHENAVFDALRRAACPPAQKCLDWTQNVLKGVPTRNVGTSKEKI
ncbi:MAG: hypothetical protein GY801_52130 [bacterium]|nr:hypothetical protein [bacterium]